MRDKLIVSEIDAGAAVNIISEGIFNRIRISEQIQESGSTLHAVNARLLSVAEKVDLLCNINNKQVMLTFFVMKGYIKYSLLGRTGLQQLWLSTEIFSPEKFRGSV